MFYIAVALTSFFSKEISQSIQTLSSQSVFARQASILIQIQQTRLCGFFGLTVLNKPEFAQNNAEVIRLMTRIN